MVALRTVVGRHQQLTQFSSSPGSPGLTSTSAMGSPGRDGLPNEREHNAP
ncbi:Protein of unknown function [Pyronema omphalodes CBS 100304]|uniref:Uncharacterized protein n=1 Tax=Pyronema omphalodes (strain CBS 100304) TaxID=1076935 RepID=U4LPG1_PYROM|nr:Protein of unknown function [Pyronema omphalodes CBS 100304]